MVSIANPVTDVALSIGWEGGFVATAWDVLAGASSLRAPSSTLSAQPPTHHDRAKTTAIQRIARTLSREVRIGRRENNC
jgi:hypothetical protein